jgi:hypothetical protein
VSWRPDGVEMVTVAARGLERAARRIGIYDDRFAELRDIAGIVMSHYVSTAMSGTADPAVLAELLAAARATMEAWGVVASVEDTKPLRFGLVDADAARLCGLTRVY